LVAAVVAKKSIEEMAQNDPAKAQERINDVYNVRRVFQKNDIVKRFAKALSDDPEAAAKFVMDGKLDTLYESFKKGYSEQQLNKHIMAGPDNPIKGSAAPEKQAQPSAPEL